MPKSSVIEEAIFNLVEDSFQIQTYNIIEAGFRHGVIERAWNPDEYSKRAVYRLIEQNMGQDLADDILHYARGNIGKRYAFEKLALLIPRFIRDAILPQCLRIRQDTESGFYKQSFLGTGHICSSLVDDCFMQLDYDLVPDIDTPWVLPDDIRDSPLLELLPPEGTVEWKER